MSAGHRAYQQKLREILKESLQFVLSETQMDYIFSFKVDLFCKIPVLIIAVKQDVTDCIHTGTPEGPGLPINPGEPFLPGIP